MSEASADLYQQMILEHNKKPRNFRRIEGATHFAEGYNPLCGDHYAIFVNVGADNIIEDVSFTGEGCAISKASASIMTQILKGKTINESLKIFHSFHDLLRGKGEVEIERLKVFSGIWKFPSRVKCASLAWHAFNNATEHLGTAKTE